MIAQKLEQNKDCEKLLEEIPACSSGGSSPFMSDDETPVPPLVIFLHGVNLFGFVWDPFAKLLARRGYQVLSFDFYGHGYSAIPNVDYTSDVLCEQVEELVTRLRLANLQSKSGGRQIYVVGHSMGGLIASEFTARHGDVVTKLILLNSVGLPVNTRAHLIPGVVHVSLVLFRHIRWFDNILLRVGQIIGTHTRLLGMTHHDILEAAHNLSEEMTHEMGEEVSSGEEEEELPPLLDDDDDEDEEEEEEVQLIVGKGSSTLVNRKRRGSIFSGVYRAAHRINKIPLQGIERIRRRLYNSHRRYSERISYVTKSIRGLSFVVKAWMYQCSLSVERGRVWLSLFRHIPLLDAGRHETFSKIADKKTPMLLIWGNDDSILPSSLVAQFQSCIPHVKVEMLDGDHGLFLQKPNKIFSIIYRFISHANDQ